MSGQLSLQHYMSERHPDDKALQVLLKHLSRAAVRVARRLTASACETSPCMLSPVNVHGEIQDQMDIFADLEFIRQMRNSGACFAVISEEQPDIVHITTIPYGADTYVIAIDPLDGSSNLAVNLPVGSIFAIYKRHGKTGDIRSVGSNEVLVTGDPVAAGYFLYSSSTILVYADRLGVDGFTLDTASGNFMMTNAAIRIPENGNTYSINDGNHHLFNQGTRNYIRFCRQQADVGEVPYTARYTGSMVADIHRLLMRGGVFLYPATHSAPRGKLRLAYECKPMAFIVEKAGGMAITGTGRILDVPMTSLHQRTPIVIGSRQMVITAERFMNSTIPSLSCTPRN